MSLTPFPPLRIAVLGTVLLSALPVAAAAPRYGCGIYFNETPAFDVAERKFAEQLRKIPDEELTAYVREWLEQKQLRGDPIRCTLEELIRDFKEHVRVPGVPSNGRLYDHFHNNLRNISEGYKYFLLQGRDSELEEVYVSHAEPALYLEELKRRFDPR